MIIMLLSCVFDNKSNEKIAILICICNDSRLENIEVKLAFEVTNFVHKFFT